jgi:hypothetical protein
MDFKSAAMMSTPRGQKSTAARARKCPRKFCVKFEIASGPSLWRTRLDCDMSLTLEAEGAMTDPKDLEHYLEERIGEKNKAAQQDRQSAEREEAEIRKSQNRRHAAITLLTDTIIPFLEESKKAMTEARLVVNPKVTNDEVAGVTFQIRDREEKAVHSSVYEIDIGMESPLVRSRKEADEQSAGVDLADQVGVRKFEDLDTKAVAQLLKIAIDEYISEK